MNKQFITKGMHYYLLLMTSIMTTLCDSVTCPTTVQWLVVACAL